MNKKLLGLLALPLVALPMVACHSSNAATDKAKAETPAALEDAQLKADGYDALHIPGFGKADLGVKGHSYEAAIYTGKLTATVVDSATKKHEPGVVITGHGKVTVVTAASLSDLKNGVKAVAKGL